MRKRWKRMSAIVMAIAMTISSVMPMGAEELVVEDVIVEEVAAEDTVTENETDSVIVEEVIVEADNGEQITEDDEGNADSEKETENVSSGEIEILDIEEIFTDSESVQVNEVMSLAATTTVGKREWKWPVPSENRLSSCFDDNRSIPHKGIDIYTGKKGNAIYGGYGNATGYVVSCC